MKKKNFKCIKHYREGKGSYQGGERKNAKHMLTTAGEQGEGVLGSCCWSVIPGAAAGEVWL